MRMVRDATKTEQTLVDAMFEIALRAEELTTMDREARAHWVSKQLYELGVPTVPQGMSWGVIVSVTEKPDA